MKTEAEIKQVIAGMLLVLAENHKHPMPEWTDENRALLLKGIHALAWVVGWPSNLTIFEETLKKDIAESEGVVTEVKRMLTICESLAAMGIPITKDKKKGDNENKPAQPTTEPPPG